MRKDLAIAFGAGKESIELLRRYKRYKPILVSCIGEKDTVDIRVYKDFATFHGLSFIPLYIKSGFSDTVILQKQANKILKVVGYTNVILENEQFIKLELKLICGRRKKDLYDRQKVDSGFKIIGSPDSELAKFPLWNNNA